MAILKLGHCLAIELVTRLFHGPLAPGTILNLHPTAIAAWLGLFATALNLLPLGQLDGGHILYAALGRAQRRVALPLWLGLALLGYLWPGWLLWCLIVLVIGLFHPPVYDESEPLDGKRRALAWVALVLFVLCFIPVPLSPVVVR
jgi:membrane-associated protease RseP (regulator of RpoE activity)